MITQKTKSLENIEERMDSLDQNSLRYQALECAKNFKTSWIALGRALYSTWKDKLYKEWGYATFDAYTAREIGIKKQTSMKLLRSYYFLEKEEPGCLKDDYRDSAQASRLPNYESVNILRMARNKKIDSADYFRLKREILEKGKDAREARKDLTGLIRQREELQPEEAWQKKKISTVRRFLGTLKALKQEIEDSKMLPSPIIKEAASLIKKLEAEIS